MKPMHERPSLAALAAAAASSDACGGCRRCGCFDVRDVAGRRVCRHCGTDRGPAPRPRAVPQGTNDAGDPIAGEDELGIPPTVASEDKQREAPVASCPACGSLQVRVTSSRKLLRHYRCDSCGERFKLPRD